MYVCLMCVLCSYRSNCAPVSDMKPLFNLLFQTSLPHFEDNSQRQCVLSAAIIVSKIFAGACNGS